MRYTMLIVAALTLAAADRAGATPAVGTCAREVDGPAFEGIVGLAIPDGQGGFASVAAAAVPYVFGGAECSCASDDVQLEIRLTTALPAGTTGTAEVWVGAGCDNATTRTVGLDCERVATLPIDAFTVGAAPGPIHVPIASKALYAPVTHVCPALDREDNGIYVFLFAQPNAPFAGCALSLVEKARPPAAPTGVKVTRSADGVAHLSWSPPAASSDAPVGYQVLCADSTGKPLVQSVWPEAGYSVCEPGGSLKRRSLPTTTPIGTPGGVPLLLAGTLEAFDPSFVCSSIVSASADRVDVALPDAGESYQLQLVALDQSGNFAPASLVSVGAAPVMAPGGKGGGGCALGGQGEADGTNLALGALGLGLLAAWRMRERARAAYEGKRRILPENMRAAREKRRSA